MKLSNCRDRDETILRMGFRAAEQGYNSVVEVVVERIAQKRNFWQGTGTPAHIDAAKHARWDMHANAMEPSRPEDRLKNACRFMTRFDGLAIFMIVPRGSVI